MYFLSGNFSLRAVLDKLGSEPQPDTRSITARTPPPIRISLGIHLLAFFFDYVKYLKI
jgi:hypothetical protein